MQCFAYEEQRCWAAVSCDAALVGEMWRDVRLLDCLTELSAKRRCLKWLRLSLVLSTDPLHSSSAHQSRLPVRSGSLPGRKMHVLPIIPLDSYGIYCKICCIATKTYIEVVLDIAASILGSCWMVAQRVSYSQGAKPWHLLAVMEIVLFIPTLRRFLRAFLKALNLEEYHAVESEVLSGAVLHPFFTEMKIILSCCKIEWCLSVVWFRKLNFNNLIKFHCSMFSFVLLMFIWFLENTMMAT